MKNLLKIFIIFQISWLLQAVQPTTVFCHGIVDNHTQFDRYHEYINSPQQTFDFDDAQQPDGWNLNNLIFNSCTLFGKPVNLEKMYMGHGQDIETLATQIDPTTSYILYGMSRGGATILNYLGQYNPKNICAIILDGTPADMVSAINLLQYELGYKFCQNRTTQETIFNALFPAYPINSTPPVENIQKIENKNIPIFIVHSQQDTRVDISSAWKNYLAFKKAGFEHVYLCELQTGNHGHYMHGSQANIYLRALHTFYQHHNFAYNKIFTDFDLQKLQPSVEEIEKKLALHQENLDKKYESRKALLQTLEIVTTACIVATAIYLYKNK